MFLNRRIIAVSLLALIPVSSGRALQGQTINDKDIHVIDFQDMPYPHIARFVRVQGTVVVRISLDEGGKVVDATAVAGPQLLVPDTLVNAKKWTFQPNAEKAALIVYNFVILDGKCKSRDSLFILQGANLATVITCPLPPKTWAP